MAQHRDRDLRLVAGFANIRTQRGVVDRRITRRGAAIDIDHHVALRVLQRLGQRDLHRPAVDLHVDALAVVGFRRRIEANELAVDVAAKEAFVIIAATGAYELKVIIFFGAFTHRRSPSGTVPTIVTGIPCGLTGRGIPGGVPGGTTGAEPGPIVRGLPAGMPPIFAARSVLK